MISSKIRKLAKRKEVNLKDVGEVVGMSGTGFLKALKRDDFKVSTLYDLAKYFNVNITYFFQEEDSNIESININEQSEMLGTYKKLIESKDKIIDMLENELKQLKNK